MMRPPCAERPSCSPDREPPIPHHTGGRGVVPPRNRGEGKNPASVNNRLHRMPSGLCRPSGTGSTGHPGAWEPMDILIVEPLDPEVMHWLVARHAVRYAPDLGREPRNFRQALYNVRSMIIPPSVALDAETLHHAPMLRAVGRLSAGAENIDVDACARAGVEVVRPSNATAAAEAEFVVGALLQMLRRVPVVNAEGLLVIKTSAIGAESPGRGIMCRMRV